MSLLDPTTQLAVGGVLLALVAGFLLLQPTDLVRWLRKKNYQYEVTFALYMLTPTEKFILNSILFLTLAMLTIACTVYLPNHILTISRRAYYYFAGDDAAFVDATRASLGETVSKASEAVLEAASGLYQAAHQSADVAREAATKAA